MKPPSSILPVHNCLLIAMLLCLPCISYAADTTFLFVSKSGNDGNNGTMDRPFLSLEKARNAVRAAGNKLTVVYIREGVYQFKKSFDLNEEDAPPENGRVIYKAYKNESVSFNGGISLSNAGITKVYDREILKRLAPNAVGKVYQVSLSGENAGTLHSFGFRRPYYPSAMELFIDKRPMHLARYPNDSNLLITQVTDVGSIPANGDFSNKGGTIKYEISRPERWTSAAELWIGGYFLWGWADDAMRVKNIDIEKKTITTNEAAMFGFGAGTSYRNWYVFNLLEEIDAPGEYFIDRKLKMLYFFSKENPFFQNVEISLLEDPLVTMKGCRNISFENITFENSRGIGVYMENGSNNLIKNCTLRNIGSVAVVIGKGVQPFETYKEHGTGEPICCNLGSWHEHIYENTAFNRMAGENNGIDGCEIYNLGNGAVSLGGGDRRTLKAAGNFVTNCDLHHFNRLGKSYKAGINIDGAGNIISHNHIHHAEQSGIYLHGNNHLIAFNEIDNTCLNTDDMGAIYMGRDPSEGGNAFRHNYFHHIKSYKPGYRTAAIFLDDGTMGVTITDNVFFQTGSVGFGAITVNGGGNHQISKNTFLECPDVFTDNSWDTKRWLSYLSENLWQKRLYIDVDIRSGPFKTQYPHLQSLIDKAVQQSAFSENNMVNCGIVNAELRKGNVVSENLNGSKSYNSLFTQTDKMGIIADNTGNPNDKIISKNLDW